MPIMPTREQLRTEFDAAIQDLIKMRPGDGACTSTANLTSAFYAAIGDSVFEAGLTALQDSTGASAAHGTCEPLGAPGTTGGHTGHCRLHVVSAPVGSGKTSFAMALITAVVRLQEHCADLPFGCLWVVDQMTKADEMYRTLNQLLPDQVAVWSSDHDAQCKSPTKVHHPAKQFGKDDLQHYPVAIVTHAFFGGKGSHKARQVLHRGKLQPRALTVIDERPEEVTVFDVEFSAAERVRELVKADERYSETVGTHMDALAHFMFHRTFGGCSIEKPTDEQEAWKAADGLQWFATAEAAAFVRDNRGTIPDVEAVFGFAKALAQGYAFIARLGGGEQGTHFIGYENKLIMSPGMLLLDATADIDGVRQLCPWRQHRETPQANYKNLSIVHVPAHTRKRLSNYFTVPKQRRDYVNWMTTVIRDHMDPGQFGLVVCKKKLFDEEHLPNCKKALPEESGSEDQEDHAAPEHEHFCWDIDGRKLCAIHWGTGIGDNTWQHVDVVFLFDEFHLPRRTVIATAQGLQHHKSTEGDLARMKALNSTAKKVDRLQEGHLLRWTKQMALRGNGRRYDEHGVCGQQKLVCSGDLKRLMASADRLFPGASITTIKPRTPTKQSQAKAFLELLGRPGLSAVLTTRWVGQQMRTPWRNVGKHVLPQDDVQRAMENLRWRYEPGKGCRGGVFRRVSDTAPVALAA